MTRVCYSWSRQETQQICSLEVQAFEILKMLACNIDTHACHTPGGFLKRAYCSQVWMIDWFHSSTTVHMHLSVPAAFCADNLQVSATSSPNKHPHLIDVPVQTQTKLLEEKDTRLICLRLSWKCTLIEVENNGEAEATCTRTLLLFSCWLFLSNSNQLNSCCVLQILVSAKAECWLFQRSLTSF